MHFFFTSAVLKEGSAIKVVQAVISAGAFSVQAEAGWEGSVLSVGKEDALVEFTSPEVKLWICRSDHGKFRSARCGPVPDVKLRKIGHVARRACACVRVCVCVCVCARV